MRGYRTHGLWICLVVLLVALARPFPAAAAAPRILLISGPPLSWPVILDDWEENLRLMGAISDAATLQPEALEGRPYLHLAYFWGPEWDTYIQAGKPAAALRPEDGNQHGRFYPATGDQPAIVTFDVIPGPGVPIRQITPDGLAILQRHGVPVRLDQAVPAQIGAVAWTWARSALQLPALALGTGVLLAGGLATLAWRRRRRTYR